MTLNVYNVVVPFFLLFLIACSKNDANPLPDPLANVNLDKGLLAHYPFNGNINDASGNALHGIFKNGASLIYDKHGNANAAANFTGSGQKIIVPNNGKLKFDTALTVSFQVMPRTKSRSNYISVTDNETVKGTSFVLGTPNPGNENFIFSVSNDEVTCDIVQNPNQVSNIDAQKVLQPESWYNIICIFNKGQMKLYINGNLISSRQSADNLMHICPDAELLIGGWWDKDPTASLNGKLDEIRLYDRPLNDVEIKELSKNFKDQ